MFIIYLPAFWSSTDPATWKKKTNKRTLVHKKKIIVHVLPTVHVLIAYLSEPLNLEIN